MGQQSEERNGNDKTKVSHMETDFVKIDKGVVYITER